ncbi:MAG: neutral zinc metallopeptidase [Sphingomonas sp.]|uniref:KPN_02809 family neutral zinc metallopeptidase n=1 Tax=Sphingomonas sp. TaxID=28214 RepID=UPI0025F238E1|nr:neutral zinc metallopeptidase [Sphingomonas sp.]MBX3566087.1 neutral zinc metallopeptidase [Sphingomonas sp.]
MRLDDIDPTSNARDRGFGGGGGGGGGLFNLLFFLPMIFGRKIGCLMMVVILGAVAMFGMFGGGGINTGTVPASQVAQGGASGGKAACNTAERVESCKVMTLADRTWDQIFREAGEKYTPATINFFTGSVQSGCGSASSAVGPFYCPADDGVYLDTKFFDELSQRFGAKGDVARIYVIAHEMGHHIQDLLGTSDQVARQQAQSDERGANRLSVQLELQADCFAGVFFGRNKDRLESGDIEEGMTAANAIGDDTLQRGAQGGVRPETFTHGTSAQRMAWLRKGLESGDPGVCNTSGEG